MIAYLQGDGGEAVAPYRQLRAPRGPDAPMVLEGFTALERLVSAGGAVHSVLSTEAALPRLQALLPADVPYLVAPAVLLREIVGFAFHRGVLALAPRPTPILPQRLTTVVMAECIADPSNVGALVRNARALGADALFIDAQSGDPFGRRAIRASMGCCFHVPIFVGPVLPALAMLRQKHPGLRLVAASCQDDAAPLPTFVWPSCCALVVGNEGFGLSDPLLAAADARVRIPMATGADSLNVAAATAVLLYERRRGAALEPRTKSR